MADWREILDYGTYTDGVNSKPSNDTVISLEYDASSISYTQVTVRFKFNRITTYDYFDAIYLLYDPDNTHVAYVLKTTSSLSNQSIWPHYSNSFTVKKGASESSFSIKPFWVCNNGSSNNFNAGLFKNGSSRAGYKKTFGESSFAGPIQTSGTNPTLGISDMNDNRIRFYGISGGNGINNPVHHSNIYVRYGSDRNVPNPVPNDGYTDCWSWVLGADSKAKYASSGGFPATGNSVYAKAFMRTFYGNGTYLDSGIAGPIKITISAVPTNLPSDEDLIITSSKNKFTNKETWTLKWKAAKPGNNDSNIIYRIRLCQRKKGETEFTKINILDKDGKSLTTHTSNDGLDRAYDLYNPKVIDGKIKLEIDPKKHGFQPGDEIKYNLYFFTRTGAGTQYFTGNGTVSGQRDSKTYTVQQSVIVNIKSPDGWRDGEVFIKTENGWKEAETVYIKTENGWKESE